MEKKDNPGADLVEPEKTPAQLAEDAQQLADALKKRAKDSSPIPDEDPEAPALERERYHLGISLNSQDTKPDDE